jgi:hypothetical protein
MRGSELASLMNKVKQLKKFFPPKRLRAFPFGDAGGNSVLSTHPRLSFLPPRQLAEQLVENYLVTYEATHPLLEVQGFREEFGRLWKQPDSVTDSWLAQVYLMIALSCYSAHQISFSAVVGGHVGLSERCVDGAEASLMARGLFITKPDLTTLRALCMLVIAKRIDIITLDDLGSQWTLMGFVERVAMTMSLHIGTSAFPAMPEAEATARSRIWNTIMVLSSYVSLDSGMPMLLRRDDYNESALLQQESQASPVSLQNSESPSSATGISDPYQSLLAEAMPTISLVLNRVNSPSATLDAVQLAACDKSIRQCLQKAQTYLPFPRNGLMEVLLLRCSMAIHQPRALEGEPSQSHPSTSLRSLNQSALALLKIQNALWEQPAHRWLADLLHRDFGIAGLAICVGLRNGTLNEHLGDPSLSRAAAWAAWRGDHNMMKENVLRSRHYFKVFRSFSVLTGILEALENGTSIREAVYKAGLMVITTVEECVGRQLEIQISESQALDPALRNGSTGQLDANFEPGTFVSPPAYCS